MGCGDLYPFVEVSSTPSTVSSLLLKLSDYIEWIVDGTPLFCKMNGKTCTSSHSHSHSQGNNHLDYANVTSGNNLYGGALGKLKCEPCRNRRKKVLNLSLKC